MAAPAYGNGHVLSPPKPGNETRPSGRVMWQAAGGEYLARAVGSHDGSIKGGLGAVSRVNPDRWLRKVNMRNSSPCPDVRPGGRPKH